MRKHRQKGFTLMELMVVIVIVAILAAVAVPLYINYVRDAQRTEARGAIGAIVSAEQVHIQRPENLGNYYTGAASADDIETNLGIDLTESKVNWAFTIEVNGDPSDGFLVTAQGVEGRPSAGLRVEYRHSRSAPLANPWTEE